ncbi:MAG: hypothetical protein Fur0032_00110 [Terrimicrobiaceae bacterium]
MEQLIQSISAKLSLPEATVRQGLGIILNFLKTKASGTEFEKILSSIPGAEAAAQAAASQSATTEAHPLSSLITKASGLLGQDAAAATEAIAALQKAGIPLDQAAPLASEFVNHARGLVGPETVDAVLDKVPALKTLLK